MKHRVHVVALANSTAFVPLGFVDLLRKAAAIASSMPNAAKIDVKLVSPGAALVVDGAGGLRVTCDVRMANVTSSDLVIVPPLDPAPDGSMDANLAANAAVAPWLAKLHKKGADVASACTGAFVLAEAGLLDDKAATTHWAFQHDLARRHPKIRLEPQAIVVDQGRVVTAGGATSFLNLALFVIEKLLGPEIARASSRMFLIDPNKAPQSAYAMFGTQKLHDDDDILRAQAILEREVSRPPSVDELAKRVHMSRRNFVRRFTRATGNSPRDYQQRVRVEAAKRALESTRAGVAHVAARVGYDDVAAFRRMFARWTGLTPADYRARYARS